MRILGFPVSIRPGYALFMALVVATNGIDLGIWLAGAITVFTLAHELGHALAARRTGAEARIALDFLAGYAAFEPTRALTRFEKVVISASGPTVQIVLGVVVLVVTGVNPLLLGDHADDAWAVAIWWAGPMIGLLNLLPLLPLDGGQIAVEAVDTLRPGQGRRIMESTSMVLTGAIAGGTIMNPVTRPIGLFAIVVFVMQFQIMLSRRPRNNDAARIAEDEAWNFGRPGIIAPPQRMSPWWTAYTAACTSRHDKAVDAILSDLAGDDGPHPQWWPPEAATTDKLKLVVACLPMPMPDPTESTPLVSAVTLVDVLRRTGKLDEAIRWGALAFNIHPCTPIAVDVARCVALRGYSDVAVQWLEISFRLGDDPDLLVAVINGAPELHVLRHRPEVSLILETLTPAE